MQVYLVPQWYELYLSKARLTEIDDVPLVSVETRNLPPAALELKRAVDLVVGLLLLVVLSPLLGLVAGALHRKKGKAFKQEIRCGETLRPFRCISSTLTVMQIISSGTSSSWRGSA